MNKKILRQEYRGKIRSLLPELKAKESAGIKQQLRGYLESQSGYWTLFHPLPDEPDLLSIANEVKNIIWLFPKVEGEGPLTFMVANSERKIPLTEIAGFIIPALAYDAQGVRLGRGGGHYDQTLAASKGLRIGVAFAASLSPVPLPKDDHDQLMDVVVSYQQTIVVRKVNHVYS